MTDKKQEVPSLADIFIDPAVTARINTLKDEVRKIGRQIDAVMKEESDRIESREKEIRESLRPVLTPEEQEYLESCVRFPAPQTVYGAMYNRTFTDAENARNELQEMDHQYRWRRP